MTPVVHYTCKFSSICNMFALYELPNHSALYMFAYLLDVDEAMEDWKEAALVEEQKKSNVKSKIEHLEKTAQSVEEGSKDVRDSIGKTVEDRKKTIGVEGAH